MANNLAALLKEPTASPTPEMVENVTSLSGVTSVTTVTTMSQPLMATSSTPNGSPATSPRSSPPISQSSSSPNPIQSLPGLPAGLPAGLPNLPPGFPPVPGLGLLRHPLTLPSSTSSPQSPNAQTLLLSNPFLPPGIMLPGMPNLPNLPPGFPRFPGLSPDGRLPTSPTSNSAATVALQNLSRLPDTNSLKRSSPMSDILNDNSLNPEQKKMRLQSSMRMLKDEPVPEGYMRFR